MSDERANFKAWYVDSLNILYPIRNAGIPLFMISLPLAERFIRQKNKVGPDTNLTEDCMGTLGKIFPALANKATAWDFWNVCRNGYLHQATFSPSTRKGKPLPVGWLTHDIADAVQVTAVGNFLVHPVLFSRAIIGAIESGLRYIQRRGNWSAPYAGRRAPRSLPDPKYLLGHRR